MGRERAGGLLLLVGLLAVAGSLLVLGLTRQVRSTSVVQSATADWIAVEEVHDAIASELIAALDHAYPTLAISDAEKQFAADRMLANGDLIDEIELAIDPAHRAWLAGSEFALELDPRVVTGVAVAGIRDANPALIESLGSQNVVDPGLIALPTWVSATSVDNYQSSAQAGLGVGVLVVVVGLLLGFRHRRTWQRLARGMMGFGLLAAILVLVLSWSAVGQLDDRLTAVGALVAPARIPWLVVAGIAVIGGLSIHGRVDRLSGQRSRTQASPRPQRDAAPARSGATPPATTRKAVRHRTEAIDAFFDPIEDERPAPATVIDLADFDEDESGDYGLAGADDQPAKADSDDDADGPLEEPDPPTPRELTPEEQRAEALAAERREALERIDGTRSRYRTHLRR